MGFYIEELPTELNGITMQEADYLADEFLKDTPCNRMWDAMRALRDFYETVTSEAVEVADRKIEPIDKDINVRSKTEPSFTATDFGKGTITRYKDEPQTERVETMSCQECKWWFTDSLKHGGYCQSLLYNHECRYEPEVDCSWK